ncbi:hypothetical protein L1987_07991 [Smallanthus sonchifolius]|uniref:Uncharacterized protein n=1 Tax=Smallanthus sonchifolius TaxID=185202 RepID=A0ACB9JJT1_9ASTR|nr:hypothetical protein L1987_07991 [Smallanthus sonchifolius]
MHCLISLNSPDLVKDFVTNRDKWKDHLVSAVVWEINYERVVKLKMNGIPIVLRDEDTFREIVGLSGRIIELFDFSWDKFDVSSGSCLVLHNSGRKIDEEINLNWDNRLYRVWVSEVEHPWPPELKVVAAPASGGEKGVVGDGAMDLEEGEFRPFVIQNSGAVECPSEVQPEIQGEGETKSLLGEDGRQQTLHGESRAAHGMGNSLSPKVDGVNVGPVQNGHVSYVGRFSCASSRKRPRNHRSPVSIDSPMGQSQGDGSCTIVPDTQPVAAVADLDKEVADTMEVGTCVGIQMETFEAQESKLGELSSAQASKIWGRTIFEMDEVKAEGRSGGMLCLWDPGELRAENVIKNRNYFIISGRLVGSGLKGHFANIYTPNDPVSRRDLWLELLGLRNSLPGFWVFLGDFNEVRAALERINSEFIAPNADKFNRFIEDAYLVEYNMGGHKFTYMSDNGLKLSKLDRILVCREFMNNWPSASLIALSRELSDHGPLILSSVPHDFGHIPFRFFNSWLEMPGFMEYVESSARLSREASYRARKARISEIESLAESRSLVSLELEERLGCKQLVAAFDLEKLKDAQQKSRVRWATDGDENSSYFHSKVNANISGNRINGLRFNGEWVSNPVLLKDKIRDYFAKKFLEPIVVRPPMEAIWECGDDRAPGPDGYNFRFLKRCWPCFEQDFYRLFEEFFKEPHISLGCSSSFIALIAKVTDPTWPHEFRPVSLVGCISKAISKILVNRLKKVIGKLISDEQSGFLSGRSIMDGSLVLNELIAWLKRSKSAGMILKVDMDKAFDSLNWSFLESVMSQMNFPLKWRKWIMACVSSASQSGTFIHGIPFFICPGKNKVCRAANRIRIANGVVVLNWDWSRLPFAGTEADELLLLMSSLASVTNSSSSEKWQWELESSGIFSVSSIKYMLADSYCSAPPYVSDWNNWVPKKVGMVAWRAEKDRLPTTETLSRRNIQISDPMCAFCGNHLEAIEHVILSCAFAQDVWQVISAWCRTLPFLLQMLETFSRRGNTLGDLTGSKKWCM